MPEEFIIHRLKYQNGAAREWLTKFRSMDTIQLKQAKAIIARNKFASCSCDGPEVKELLAFYSGDYEKKGA